MASTRGKLYHKQHNEIEESILNVEQLEAFEKVQETLKDFTYEVLYDVGRSDVHGTLAYHMDIIIFDLVHVGFISRSANFNEDGYASVSYSVPISNKGTSVGGVKSLKDIDEFMIIGNKRTDVHAINVALKALAFNGLIDRRYGNIVNAMEEVANPEGQS